MPIWNRGMSATRGIMPIWPLLQGEDGGEGDGVGRKG